VVERQFAPISLESLNAKAEMLTRLDNKYVVPMQVLNKLAPELGTQFDILEIDGKRGFDYRTQYFYTPTMCSFRHHIQGRRIRLSYPDCGSWGLREARSTPTTLFMVGSGGGWIASSWVVMDRFGV